MHDMKLIRDVVAKAGSQAGRDDAEDIMRLAHDPLLLHEHLQSRDRSDASLQSSISDGRLETFLHVLAERNPVRPAMKTLEPAARSYVPQDRLFEPSLRPTMFAASGEDRKMAIDQASVLVDASGEEAAVPPDLIGGILVVFGCLLVGSVVFDLFAAG